jgi:hypothetical protein
MKIYDKDGKAKEIWGMYLWSNPTMPAYLRLPLGVLYIPLLLWWWLTGQPIEIGRESNEK